MRKFQFLITFFLCILTGCVSIGPSELCINRKLYNDVAKETEQEQLLKNIVRIRYFDAPYFLSLSSVTGSYSLGTSLSGSPNLSYTTNGPLTSWSVTKSLGLNPSVAYSDSPTLSFSPVADSQFAREIMTPLTMAQLLIPYSSGPNSTIYDFIFVARLVFGRMEDLSNADSIVSSKIIEMPKYEKFYRALSLILELRTRGVIDIRQYVLSHVSMIRIQFNSKADSILPAAIELKKLLHAPADSDNLYLSDEFDPCPMKSTIEDVISPNQKKSFRADCPLTNTVHVELRSIQEIIRYLSFGVEVPPCDLQKGYALQLRYPDGTLFDLQPLYHSLFHVYWSDCVPQDAIIKTYYHGHWFYISDTDLDSKVTFRYLQSLIILLAGNQVGENQTKPVLTIPV